MNAFVEL